MFRFRRLLCVGGLLPCVIACSIAHTMEERADEMTCHPPELPDQADAGAITAGFVAVGANGTILQSDDGVEWRVAVSGTDADLRAVAFGNSAFVAVGTEGTVLKSYNGLEWEKCNSETSIELTDVTHTGEQFVAVGGAWEEGAVSLVSNDGSAWDAIEAPSSYMFHAVTRFESTAIAFARLRSDLHHPALFVRESGESHWTVLSKGEDYTYADDFYGGAFVDGSTFAVGNRHLNKTSDGATWERSTLPTERIIYGIAHGDGLFAVVGELGAIYTSADATTWVGRSALDAELAYFNDVAFGTGIFVAAGANGGGEASGAVIVTSPDGQSWTRGSVGIAARLASIAFGANP